MMDWDDIQVFLAIAREGSVTAAARSLGVNHSTVSRRISGFEGKLGVRLFERLASGYVTTSAGEDILGAAERMEEEAATLHRRVFGQDDRLNGLLRVTATDVVTNTLLLPALTALREQHPEIEVQLMVSNDPINLNRREADIAFRITNEPPENLIGQRLAKVATGIYGSIDYLSRHEGNSDNDDLEVLTWIIDGCTSPTWVAKHFPRANTHYRVDSIMTMLEAAKQGMGIVKLPCLMGDAEPTLRRVPGAPVEEGWDLWVLTHADLRKTARVRIFRDFMVEAIKQKRDLIEGRHPQEETGIKINNQGTGQTVARTSSAIIAE